MSASDAELLSQVSRISADLQQILPPNRDVTTQLQQCRKLLSDIDSNVNMLLQQRQVLQQRLRLLQEIDYPFARRQLLITEILGARLTGDFDSEMADHVMARHDVRLIGVNGVDRMSTDEFLDKVPRTFEFSAVMIVLRTDLLYHYVLDEDGEYWWFEWSACHAQCQFCLNQSHNERRAQLACPLLVLKK